MTARLSQATLGRLPGHVARPGYDRASLSTGIVHLGIGAFHRAHQAAYLDALLPRDPRWGIVGASLRSPAVRDQMMPQDGLFTLVEQDGADERLRVVGSVLGVLTAAADMDRLVAAMASPGVHIVTLTITEKGYVVDPARADGGTPPTAPDLLVAALALRRARNLPPFTVISCDNLADNGRHTRDVVLAAAARRDPHLRDWIAAAGAFPSSMIDRIVPATTAADRARLTAVIGLDDQAMVKTEPFRQWVIEDRFAGPRPEFESVGVALTDDVGPWEHAKLRLLNGAHSALAYLGGLAGGEYVHDVLAMPGFAALTERLWDESETTFASPSGLDIARYRGQLMTRFRNAALAHRTHQIAMDGSRKLPQRLLAPLGERIAQGQPADALALAVAGWMRWQRGSGEDGTAYVVDDPLAAKTRRIWATAGPDPAAIVADFLTLDEVFSAAFNSDERVRSALTEQLRRLLTKGAARAVERIGRADI